MPTIRRNHIKLKRNSICPCEENMSLPEGDTYTRTERKKYKHCCLKKIQVQEQKTYEMIHENKRIEEAKKIVAASIQHDIDHPILMSDDTVIVPTVERSKIIIP